MSTVEIDLRLFIVEALASNPKIEKLLNNYYKLYKFEAYEIAKNSPLYNHPMITDGSIKKEVLSKRALGLILLSQQNEEVSSIIDKLFKKGWPKLSKYISTLQKNNKPFDLDYVFEKIYLPRKEYATDESVFSLAAFGYLAAVNAGLEFVINDSLSHTERCLYNTLTFYEEGCEQRYSFENIDKGLYKKAKDLLERIEQKYGDRYFKNIDNLFTLVNKGESKYERLRLLASKLSFFFDDECCMAANMFEQDISNRLKLEVLAIFCLTHEIRNVDDAAEFLVLGVLFKKLIVGYKEVKKYYFENNQETMFLELSRYQAAEKKAVAEQERIQKAFDEIKSENARLKKDYKSNLESEIVALKQEIASLKEKEKSQNMLTREVASLRSALYQPEEESHDHRAIDIEKINSYKGIIIGGHQNWHQQIKKQLDFDCVLEANTHLLEHIDEYDVVLFKTSYLDHPTYFKVIEKVRRSTPIFGYLQHSNVDLCLEEIEKIIDEK